MTTDFPPEYVAAVARVSKALRSAIDRGLSPRFRFPPEDVVFAAPLDAAEPHVCVNDDARRIVPALMHAGNGETTCFMLQAALSDAGIGYETATLAEMGLERADGGA